MAQNPTKLTITVLGTGGVGKTAFTIQYVQGSFMEAYDPTIANTFTKSIVVGSTPLRLDINDTAGTDQYANLSDEQYKESDGFIIMYSITDKSSFLHVDSIFERVNKCRNDPDDNPVPILLVGNKCDLPEKRTVNSPDAIQKAEKLGIKLFEASAKAKINLNESWDYINSAAFQFASRRVVVGPHQGGSWFSEHCVLF